MSSTLDQFHEVLEAMGSSATIHREEPGTACPCRTDEGFRDPAWHVANPDAPVCNEPGFLAPVVTEFVVKAAVQPAIARLRTRPSQRADALLGDVQKDDHIGIFPAEWNGNMIDFRDWSEAGEDFVLYDDRRFIVVAADKIPDIDGNPNHHWEVGMRLVSSERPS